MGDAARSRRLAVQARRRAWGAGGVGDEGRAYLHERLALFARLVFWSFAALLGFLFALYQAYPRMRPQHQEIVYGVALGALALLLGLWRLQLVRRAPSIAGLYAIDVVIVVGSGVTFGAVAALAYDLPASSYTCLIYQSFTVFTRALVVPSSARRTAIVSSLAFVPIVAGAGVLASLGADALELPGPAVVAGTLLYTGVAVLLATSGSRIIYGLRRQVSEAMQLGQYTLERKIGEGGMGVVYHARHALLRRPTAVKLLLPDRVGADNLDRFEREVQGMARLTHPNTVAVFDYGRSPDGVLYYAMEYLGGIDLEALVRRFGPQPPARVAHILVQVCGALQEAHDAGLVHRDIKPANIILCERGGVPDVAKVVDFGLVKEIAREPGATAPAGATVLGTPGYLAPEAIVEPDRIGPAVDLYALGCVGYFLVTGRKVFDGATAVEVLLQHVTRPPPAPSSVGTAPIPAALEAAILKCLQKRPEDRFGSARALAAALVEVPRGADWDEATAHRWWRALAAADVAAPASEAPTRTITVDLDRRR